MVERALSSFLLLIWLKFYLAYFSETASWSLYLHTLLTPKPWRLFWVVFLSTSFNLDSMLHALENTNMTRNWVRRNPGMDLLTYFSQSEHATCPQRVLYHHKVGFIRADLLEYRKLEGSVNQTSPVPLHPCKAQPFFQPCSQSRSFLSLFESQQTLCRSL